MKKERGQAFILVLILLGVGAVMIIPLLHLVDTVIKGREMYGQFINEDYAADAAIEYGMWRLIYESGFAASLPPGVECEPFYITLNGVEASTTVIAQAPSGQLSGQDLAGRASDEPFKVTKTVIATSTYATLAADGFESHSPSGGTGPWIGDWVLSGDYAFSDYGSYEGSYHLRLRGGGYGYPPPEDGCAQREVDLSGSTGEGPFLNFWARVESFESGDWAKVKVSTNGIDWDVLETYDYQDSDNQWHLSPPYDLSSYGTPSSFYLAFETNLSSDHDYFHIDSVSFCNTEEATIIEPGDDTVYTYYVTIQCLDPEGCCTQDYWTNLGLDKIIDILPDRGASSGDYMQYIPGSTYWDSEGFEIFAFDGFEGGGGTGSWNGNWAFSGDCSVIYDYWGAHEGSRYLELSGGYPGDGYAQRAVDLSGSTGAGPFLYFWARIDSLESGDNVTVKVSTNGVDWDVLEVFDENNADNIYHLHPYDLTSYGRPSTLYVAFEADMSSTNDYFYVDDVEFSNFQGTAAGEWPMAPFDPTYINNSGSGSSYHQELTWDFEDKGYDDVCFDYGEIKTMSFRARAALTEGVYCNEIQAAVSSYWGWGYEDDIIRGTTAKITVGDPEETRCSGGLLTVEKTVDPVILYPNEETTVTYTITIENVDTVPITIYEIEDWLPSTGSSDPYDENNFIYVDDSTYGYILGRTSLPVLFYDNFNRSSSCTVSNWVDSDGSGCDAQLYSDYGSDYIRLRYGASITQPDISTVGNIGIVLSYQWMGYNTESTDKLRVEWKPSSSETWNILVEHPLNYLYSWQNANHNLPATADNTQIDIRFTGITNQSGEYAQLDNVQVSCTNPVDITPVCMPDESGGYYWDFFYNPDGHGDWHSGQWPDWYTGAPRWELDWNFANYPNQSDPVWNTGGLCGGYPYADYNPYLELQPGEIFEVVFQATVTLVASGSYYDEVFVRINEEWGGWGEDDWIYSWPTGGVTVPQYDLQAETLSSVLRAAAMLSPDGYWWRSWHWWWHR